MSCLIFNHHSIPFQTRFSAEAKVNSFIVAWQQLNRKLGFTTIRVDDSLDKSWYRIELSAGFFWQDWINDPSVDVDLKRVFKGLADKTATPLLPTENSQDDFWGVDVIHLEDNLSKAALRVANILKAPLLGHPSSPIWDTDQIPVRVEELCADDTINTCEISLLHLIDEVGVERHRTHLENQRSTSIQCGKELWESRFTAFPHIHFLHGAESNLRYWSYAPSVLNSARDALYSLNDVMAQMNEETESFFGHEELTRRGVKSSPESHSTERDPKLSRLRQFTIPETGESVFFGDHMKISTGFRIHFYFHKELRKMFVGYIGPHLRTSSDN